MTPIAGNTAAQQAFGAALASGAMHHAWLLAGPQGVGKGSFARDAALRIVGDTPRDASLIAAGSHPDFLVVEREVWDKKSPPNIVPLDERKDDDPLSKSIRVVQVRTLRSRLTTAPALSTRRAVIIDAVDDLEREGANALLKTLEEPPAGTIFFLVSHAPGRLLPTIRSRCRLLRFAALADGEVAEALGRVRPDLAGDELAALVRAGEGSPGRALRFAGLDIAGLDAAITAIAADGDADNARRGALARALAPRAVAARYEAFLDRAPAFIADLARRRGGPTLAATLTIQTRARDLAGAAVGLSLDPQATVWEMAGLLAALPR